jgi:hypothetical protein
VGAGNLHLSALAEDDFLWQPAPLCWTVRPDPSGIWRPDWADTDTVLWVAVELTKNVAEIGQLRLLRAAR